MTSTRANKFDFYRVVAATNTDDYIGFCTACGAEQGGCEPDAKKCICESCGQPAVYGAEELLFMIHPQNPSLGTQRDRR
jgi:hypothetical protein